MLKKRMKDVKINVSIEVYLYSPSLKKEDFTSSLDAMLSTFRAGEEN